MAQYFFSYLNKIVNHSLSLRYFIGTYSNIGNICNIGTISTYSIVA